MSESESLECCPLHGVEDAGRINSYCRHKTTSMRFSVGPEIAGEKESGWWSIVSYSGLMVIVYCD